MTGVLAMWWVLAAPVAPAQESAPGAHVLIKADAGLYQQPDGDDAKAKLAKNVDLEAAPHRVFYAKLIERHEGWMAVRTSSHRAACTKQLGNNPPLGLVLWVKPSDVLPVLQRPVDLEVGGVSVHVDPGVPMRSNVDGSWTAAVDGLSVTGIFPEDAIGQKFVPVDQGQTDFRASHLATGTFGTQGLTVNATEAPAHQEGGGWTLQRRCLSVTRAPQVAGTPPVPGTPTNDGGGARRVEHAWLLQSGTSLTWPDGVSAGVTMNVFRLENDQQPDPPGRRCGPILGGDLLVCADDPEATEKPAPTRHVAIQHAPREAPEVPHPKGDVKGEAAKCRAQVDFGPGGAVQDVVVRACSEPFAAATREAVLQWTYPPFQVDGKPVPARTWTWVAFEP